MQINVSQLLQEPIGAARDHNIDDVVDVGGENKNCPVIGECHLLRTQRSILVKCILSIEVELMCSRCLGQFHHSLKVNFEEEYLPTVDVVTGSPLPLPEEASIFTIDKQHILDLTEAIRQYTLLAIPMKPVCYEDCAGLCQKCGQNLNQGSCDCPTQDTDPRWAKLTEMS